MQKCNYTRKLKHQKIHETRQIDYNDFINELLPTFIFNAILCLNIMFL